MSTPGNHAPADPALAGRLLVEQIDALLPQTQCEKCGHPGCKPYAVAIAAGEAHNKCPPGRQQTADALARLLGRPPLPLDAKPEDTLRKVAVIREDECIGCTKCIVACPVDAIVGAALKMHTVIADQCTGCDLCLPPCPVDCIDMVVLADQQADSGAAMLARRRHEAHLARQQRERRQRPEKREVAQGPARAAENTYAATTDNPGKLRAAAAMAQRQYKEAQQALARAQRAGNPDLAAMQARVEALRMKAEAATQALPPA
ncbi:MAG: RnfABCDGE type electron transport complex subunit B [Gammaproteobacteria bacterium]